MRRIAEGENSKRWRKRAAKCDTLELIARIAALVPPPRTHRHRYFGVLAPNSPLRDAVTAFATPAQQVTVQTDAQAGPPGEGEGTPGLLPQPTQPEPVPVPPKRAPSHYLWAVLIARFLRFCTDRPQ